MVKEENIKPDNVDGMIAEKVQPKKGTALLVDDEEIVRNIGKAMLERLGFIVLVAKDGQEAVKKFSEQAGEILFVLLDFTMPGMDGVVAFQELKKIRKDAVVIIISGFAEKQIARQFDDDSRPSEFVQKPFQMDTLEAKINKVIKKSKL